MGYAYIDKLGVLHITKYEERAKKYGKEHVYIETDLPAAHGYPIDDFCTPIIIKKSEHGRFLINQYMQEYSSKTSVLKVVDLYEELDNALKCKKTVFDEFVQVVKSIFGKDLL